MEHKLYVRGPPDLSKGQLQDLFEKYGKVENIRTGEAGFAFVDMASETDCDEAIRGLDGTMVDGQKITVQKAKGTKDKGANSEFRCYNCQTKGHMARDCKEKPRNPMYLDTRGTKAGESSSRYHPYDRERPRGDRDDRRMDRDRDRDRPPSKGVPPRRSPPPKMPYDDRHDRPPRFDVSPERRYPPDMGFYRSRDPMYRGDPYMRGRSPERGGPRDRLYDYDRRLPPPPMDYRDREMYRRPMDPYYLDRRERDPRIDYRYPDRDVRPDHRGRSPHRPDSRMDPRVDRPDPRVDPRDIRPEPRDPRDPRVDPRADQRTDPARDPRADPRDGTRAREPYKMDENYRGRSPEHLRDPRKRYRRSPPPAEFPERARNRTPPPSDRYRRPLSPQNVRGNRTPERYRRHNEPEQNDFPPRSRTPEKLDTRERIS